MTSNRHLQLINPEEQFQEQVWEQSGDLIVDPNSVKAKIYFFLHWASSGAAKLVLPNGSILPVTLSYDTDEAEPSCLWLELPKNSSSGFGSLQVATVVISIFKATYRLRANVVDRDQFCLFISLPDSLEVLGARNFPRHEIKAERNHPLKRANWVSKNGQRFEITIESIGLKTLNFMSVDFQISEGEVGEIKLGSFTTEAKCVKTTNGNIICEWLISDSEYHKFFEIYASVSFPKLRTRTFYSGDDVFALYKNSGYFGQFGKADAFKPEIISTWNSLSVGHSYENVDYVTQDQELKPIGASSLTKAFVHGKTNYWAFHQLCALRREEEIDTTGLLYSWRAEYLLGLKEDCMALVWYRSRSRFIEKIYSKLARNRPDKIRLSPVHLVKGTLKVSENFKKSKSRVAEISFGEQIRHCTYSNSVVGGYGPKWLNTSGLLNCVFTLSDEDSSTLYTQEASNLLSTKGEGEGEFYFCYLNEKTDSGLDGAVVGESDRFCVFSKTSLMDLLASIEHGIAVAKRKKEIA
ncbi:MAG: hypothetical protein JST04_08295 [Bdellovibrionales bacterium]|nr:hypothetical protein [Bdellovibrionales bacterium]